MYNHRFFHERLALEVERSGRNNLELSLLMIDVDHFKDFNDRFGHLAGDMALKHVAELLSADRRVNDIVARYGGEEFAVLLPDTPRDAAARLAEQMRARIQSATLGENDMSVTISIGVAACPLDADAPQPLLQAADDALYQAKRNGRNRVELAGRSDDEDDSVMQDESGAKEQSQTHEESKA
jgi:diguanylate cyclase (GGDEF)-like protein